MKFVKLQHFFLSILLFLCCIKMEGQCSLQPNFSNDLERPEYSVSTMSGHGMTVDGNGNVYTAYTFLDRLVVRKYNGTSWSTLGGSNVATSANGFSNACITLDNFGYPYVGCTESTTNQTRVYKFNGISWSAVGALDFSPGAAIGLSIVLDGNNTPYLSFLDGNQSYRMSVMKFNGVSWGLVGSAGFSAGGTSDPSIAIDKTNVPYVAFIDAANSNKGTVMSFNGTSWNAIGTAGFTPSTVIAISIAFNSTNQLYAFYGDGSNSNKGTVQMYNGTSWQLIGAAGMTNSGIYTRCCKIAINSADVPYVSYIVSVGKKCSVMQYTGGNWTYVGPVGFSVCAPVFTNAGSICLAFDNANTPHLGLADQTYLKAPSVQKFNGSSWQVLGNTGITNITSDISDMAIDQSGVTYVATVDPSNSFKLNVFKCVAGNWLQVGLPNFTAGTVQSYVDLEISSTGVPYVAFSDGANGSKLTIEKFDGTSWVVVGTAGISSGAVVSFDLQFDKNNVPHVVYSDNGASQMASVKFFNGTSWALLGSASFVGIANYSVANVSLAFNSINEPHIAYADLNTVNLGVYKYTGGNWVSVSVTGVNTTIQFPSLTFDTSDNMYIAFHDDNMNGGSISVVKNVSGTWSYVGSADALTGYNYLTSSVNLKIDANTGKPWLTFIDNNTLKAALWVFDGSSWSEKIGNIGSGEATRLATTVDNSGALYLMIAEGGLYVYKTNLLGTSSALSANSACIGASVTFNASGGETYGLTGPYTSTTANTIFTPLTLAHTGTYTMNVSQTGCGQSVYTHNLVVNNLPTVSVNSTANAVCNGASVTLTGVGASSYAWTGGVTNGVSFVPNNTSTYTVTGTDVNGCVNTATKTITVNNLPIVTANSSANIICEGTSIILSGSGASTYLWTGGALNGVSFNPTTTATYTVTGTDANGCSNVDIKHITVNPLPIVTANATSTNICMGGFTTLMGGGANIYNWTGGVVNNVAFNPTITGTYSVTGTDLNGCVNTATKTIVVNSLPVVIASASSATVCLGNDVVLNGGGAASYVWTNGVVDGINFIPAATNTYTVTGTDTNGCSNAATVLVTTNPLPTLVTNASANIVCAGSNVILTCIGNAISYSWSNGVVNGVAFTPIITTTYTVTGIGANGCSISGTKNITVNSLPTVTANASADTVCAGSSTTLIGAGGVTYVWSSGITNGVSFIPVATATYTVTGTDVNGCSSTANVMVEVNAIPSITNITTVNTVCNGSTGSAIVSVSGIAPPFNYSWSNGDTTATANNLQVGQYQIQVIDTNKCSAFQNVNINANDGPSVVASNISNAVCNGTPTGSAVINVTGGTSPYNIHWSNGDTTLSVINLYAGPYDVVVSDVNNCSSILNVSIAQPSAISNSFSITPSQCAATVGAATANPTGGSGSYSFLWDTNASNQTTAQAVNLGAGVYTVIISDINGCSLTDVAIINNSNTTLSVVTGSIVAGSCGANPSGFATVAVSGGVVPYTYSWNTGTSDSSSISGLQPGTYYCVVTDSNLCSITHQLIVPSTIAGLQQNVCIVTVDTTTETNKIIWEKTIANDIKEFKIYRESSIQNLYLPIATVPYNSLSEYTDPVANPAIHSWRYKITAVDSCGFETPYSAPHKTIHLSQNLGVGGVINLAWDQYEGFTYNSYYIWRHDPSTGWFPLDTLSTNYTTFTDFTPPSSNSRYMIEVRPQASCASTMRLANGGKDIDINTVVVKSKSNVRNNRTTGINSKFNIENSKLRVYPNPANEQLNVEVLMLNEKETTITIENMLGQVVYAMSTNKQINSINTSNLMAGVYFVKVKTSSGVIIDRVVIE